MKNYVAVTGLLASSLVSMQAFGVEREGAAKDAWIDGQLEAVYALNRHLSAFAIDTEVDKGIVQSDRQGSSDIDRDLAGELAKNIDGVVEVDNELDSSWPTRARLPRQARIDRSVRGSTMPRRQRA